MKYFILLIVAFCSYSTKAQNASSTKSPDSRNIYYQALSIHLEKSNTSEGIVYVEKNLFTDSLPKTLGSWEIKYLDGYEILHRLTPKNELIVNRIIPLQIENGSFFVTIIPFKVKKEKKQLRYLNSGGNKIIFSFDCKSNQLVFKELKRGNI